LQRHPADLDTDTVAEGMAWVGHLQGASGAVVITAFTDTYTIGTCSVTLRGQT
jgi:hypothetical protein